MPFTISTQSFGPLATGSEPLTEYVLEHEETGEFLSIIPSHGALLRQLVLRKGNELLALIKAPESPQALLADESYASALLYPFPSRIRHGIYRFGGEDYALPMNETNRDNALHGFVHGKPFAVVSQETTPTYARLVLRYEYPGLLAGYPFPFALTVTYELIQANQLLTGNFTNDRMCALRMSYSALNTGTTQCPAAFGWHPYFMLSEEPVDELTLSLPDRATILLDDDMIPTGQQAAEQAATIPLRDQTLDTPFALTPAVTPATVRPFVETILTSQKTGIQLIVGQQTGPGRLNYIVCYTPPRRDSVAIEPQTASVNAFNTGEGLSTIEPGDSLDGTMWVRLD
ncbi:aldose epimerase family protein [Spirosoma arcticum]